MTVIDQGLVVRADGKLARPDAIDWPGPPDEIGETTNYYKPYSFLPSAAYMSPYVFSLLPPGTVPVPEDGNSSSSTLPMSQQSMIPAPVVQILSSITKLPVQTLPYPFPQPNPNLPANVSCTLRLLTMTSARAHLLLVSTPLDRAHATAEGSCVWQFQMKSWGEQIDDLVQKESYSDALALLDVLDSNQLPDKVLGSPVKLLQSRSYVSFQDERRTQIRALNAVAQFREGKYDDAINTFLELDLNPAKVVALYPKRVAGRLSVPQNEWIPLFGGPANPIARTEDATSTGSSDASKEGSKEKLLERSPSPTGSLRLRSKTMFGSLLPSSLKDDDVASLSGRKRPKQPKGDLHFGYGHTAPDNWSRRLYSCCRSALALSHRQKAEGRGSTGHCQYYIHPISPMANTFRDIYRRTFLSPQYFLVITYPTAANSLRSNRGYSFV